MKNTQTHKLNDVVIDACTQHNIRRFLSSFILCLGVFYLCSCKQSGAQDLQVSSDQQSGESTPSVSQPAKTVIVGYAIPSFIDIGITDIPPSVMSIAINGYYGNGEENLYKRVNKKPRHSGFSTSKDGALWELDTQRVTPEMLGAKGNRSFDEPALNDDTKAIKNMLAYARARHVPCHLGSYYFVSGQLTLDENSIITGSGYDSSGIWCQIKNTESALVIKKSNVKIGPFEVRAQLIEKKSSGMGHIGNCVVVGDFITQVAQEPINNVNIDVLATRARHNAQGKPSFLSPAINFIGNVRSAKIRCSIKGGKTPHSIGLQSHWGGVAATGLTKPSVTYHPCNIDVSIVDPIENCRIGIVNSSSYNINISSFTIIKPQCAYLFLPGDNVNLFASKDQKRNICKNIKIGHIIVKGVSSSNKHRELITITGRGISKYDKCPQTKMPRVRQIPIDLGIDGFSIFNDDTEILQEQGCRVTGYFGDLKLGGNCNVYGFRDASIEIENACGHISLGVKADSPVKLEFSKGLNLTSSDVTLPVADTRPAIQIIGDVVTIPAVNRGDTLILKSPLSMRLHTGDIIKFNGGSHTIKQPIELGARTISLEGTKVPFPISKIMIDRSVVAKLNIGAKGNHIGVRIKYAKVNITGDGPEASKKIGYIIESGVDATLRGGIPVRTLAGVNGDKTYDFIVKGNSRLIIENSVLGSLAQRATIFGVKTSTKQTAPIIVIKDSLIMNLKMLGITQKVANLKFIKVKDNKKNIIRTP